MPPYKVSANLLDQKDVNGKVLRPRPEFADPEFHGHLRGWFLTVLKKRTTYAFGSPKQVGDVISFDNCARPLIPGEPFCDIVGRGELGKWGPNQAADPLPVRTVWDKEALCWKTYVLVVKRKDTGEWALAGGMVDPGEIFTQTVIRELREEAVDIEDSVLTDVMKDDHVILFQGINWRDPRNTWNAWMETSVVMFLIPEWISDKMKLRPQIGETLEVAWLDMQKSNLELLYADHGEYVKMAISKLKDIGKINGGDHEIADTLVFYRG